MSAQDDVDDVIQRVALAAIAYYPELPVDDPTYSLVDEVAWCLEPLSQLAPADMEPLHTAVARTVIDPSRHRQALFGALLPFRPE